MKKKLIIITLIIGLIIGVTLCFTNAKYIKSSLWQYYLKSKNFYFTSDYLNITSKNNVNKLWDGSYIQFNLNNSLNSSVFSEFDINYTAFCQIEGNEASYIGCRFLISQDDTQTGVLSKHESCKNLSDDGVIVSEYTKQECEIGGYDWQKEVANEILLIDVYLLDNTKVINDVMVNVEVTSTAPFTKTLYGTFDLHKVPQTESNIFVEYDDYDTYGNLSVLNSQNTNTCLTIAWDSNNILIQDGIYEKKTADANNYINKIELNIGVLDNRVLLFHYRNPENNYTADDYTITEIDCN